MVMKQAPSETLEVLLIDFSPVIREGLKAILTKDKRIHVIGDAADDQQALRWIRQAQTSAHPVRVVLTETCSQTMDGIQATKLIKDEFPEIAVLVLTENPNDSYIIDAIKAGAGGYIFLKDLSPEVLIKSIFRIVEGGTQITTALLRTAVENLIQNGRRTLAERTTETAHLTEREVDVLRLMGNGNSNKEISQSLNITSDTVKKHIGNIVSKLQARSRTHASIIAAQAGIIGKPVNIEEWRERSEKVFDTDKSPALDTLAPPQSPPN